MDENHDIDDLEESSGWVEGINESQDEFQFKENEFCLRWTPSGQDKELKCLGDKEFLIKVKHHAKKVIEKARQLNYFNKWTAGLEQYNKSGEECRLHLHLRFMSSKQKGSMRRRFVEWLQAYGYDTTGNAHFKFTNTTARTVEQFYGYPIKQNLDYKLCGGFDKNKLTNMHAGSRHEYMLRSQQIQEKLDKMDKKDTLFKTVVFQLQKQYEQNPQSKSSRNIADNFLQYYLDNDIPPNRQTITGYVILAKIKFNLITKDQLLDSWDLV